MLETPGAGEFAVADAVVSWLGTVDGAELSDAARVDLLAALERVGGAVCAAQTRVTVAYAQSRRAGGATRRSVAGEIGLARRLSLGQAQRAVCSAEALVDDLPETLAALTSGEISGARARVVTDRVAALEPEVRAEVDTRIAGELRVLGDLELRDAVDAAAMSVDPEAVEERRRTAHDGRRVRVRAVDDGLAWLSVLLPLVEASAAHRTLQAHAAHVLAGSGGRHEGEVESADGRTPEQIMADAALARLTGRSRHAGPTVDVALVVTDRALRGEDETPGVVPGLGPVPAAACRRLLSAEPAGWAAAGGGAEGTPSGDASAVGHAPESATSSPARGRAERRRGGHAWTLDGPEWDLERPDRLTHHRREALRRLEDAERQAERVTFRRVYVDPAGLAPHAIDRRSRIMPTAVRESLTRSPQRGRGIARAVAAWWAWVATPPAPTDVADLSSAGRLFAGLLRRFVFLRDHRCRAPWCGAPIRHIDHVRRHTDGGQTSASNGEGTCVGHNLLKEQPGWRVTVTGPEEGEDARHRTTWRTPTGHTWTAPAPPVSGWGTSSGRDAGTRERSRALSPLERHYLDLLPAA